MNNIKNKSALKRGRNRKLLITYDSLFYVFCSFFVMGIFRQITDKSFAYMAVGYVLFIGIRLVLNVYKSVLRTAVLSTFARLFLADAISGSLLLIVNFVFKALSPDKAVSSLALGCLILAFVLFSIAARVLYCYLYRLALETSSLAKTVRVILERFALIDFNSAVSGATLHFVLEPRDTVPTCINELQWIVDKFAIRGRVMSITQMNSGYINRTYRVETMSDSGRIHKYTLQRINTNVFRDPEALMDNYKLVTEVLYGTLRVCENQEKGAVQTLRPTKDGCSYFTDDSGCWRMMTYFDDVYSMDIPNSADTFEKAGYAFGSFLKALEYMDIEKIKETIPNFHNTKMRYLALEESIKQNKGGRVNDVQPEIEFIRARADKFGMISEALESGAIPLRICHNDCNLNNILFDNKTHDPVAIIDLDTVMPSSPLYDYGDSMRIGTNTAKDDEKDLSKVSCDLNMYEHYARGYLRASGDMLTERELELLPYSSLIITVEDGIRFLMDHIDGDIYYNISYPGQNLDRARTQLKLVEDMEKKLPEIKKILRKIYKDLGLHANI